MVEKNAKDSWTLWQKASKGSVAEPAIVIEIFDDFIGLESDGQQISLNYQSIDDFCKLLKQVKKLKEQSKT